MSTGERTHLLIEALKLAFHDGQYHITDPEYERVPDLASKSYAAKRALDVEDTATENSEIGLLDSAAEDADTVLLTVADGEGNVVSFINSIFITFGSGLVAGSTGITLQSRGHRSHWTQRTRTVSNRGNVRSTPLSRV